MSEIPVPDSVCDGGDLDCGSGLLLIIRSAMTPLKNKGILQVQSREISVKEDLPAWCRMVGHILLTTTPGENKYTNYFIQKKAEDLSVEKDLEQAKDYKWQIRSKWTEGMQAKIFCRNHSFTVGQPASFDTEDAFPAAIEYLLSSLAGCLVVGFQWRLSQKKIEVFNLELTLAGKSDNILVFLGMENEGNPGLVNIFGSLYIDADAEESELQTIWQETLKRSPVANSLLQQVSLSLKMRKV